MKQTLAILGAGLGVGLLLAAPALAHHSFAMFDRNREVTVSGTVKAWEFTNPHAYLQVLAPYGPGRQLKEMSLETGGVTGLLRRGYRRSTYNVGDRVSVVLHPLRNGAAGGELVEVKSADGTVRSFFGGTRVPAAAARK